MIDINLPNIITIGLIAMAFYAAYNYASNATGISIPGLS